MLASLGRSLDTSRTMRRHEEQLERLPTELQGVWVCVRESHGQWAVACRSIHCGLRLLSSRSSKAVYLFPLLCQMPSHG